MKVVVSTKTFDGVLRLIFFLVLSFASQSYCLSSTTTTSSTTTSTSSRLVGAVGCGVVEIDFTGLCTFYNQTALSKDYVCTDVPLLGSFSGHESWSSNAEYIITRYNDNVGFTQCMPGTTQLLCSGKMLFSNQECILSWTMLLTSTVSLSFCQLSTGACTMQLP
eukprot:TRINITY_DN2615_c0_g1_i1.p1 TRINITY_DN2615_c0_g1~~TRINITY_DN2615_c0_g1_i1.p1  ORF type:complete len:180 (-),score=27.19 TRINITY_DN2615_c0_g1_i1:125-616(-)